MERPTIKDKAVLAYVEEIESKLERYEKSPYKDSYTSLLFQIESWNGQLKTTPIDLFGESTEKAFERAHKYFTEQKPYFEQLEYLRKLMSPEEIKEADSRKMSEQATAEKYIFKTQQ